jgi:hypothetical protein
MTRSLIAALLLAGIGALGGVAAQAQNASTPPDAVASSATPVAQPSAPTAGVMSSTVSVQLAGSGGEAPELVPMAPTVDNRANNPPVSSATGSSASSKE